MAHLFDQPNTNETIKWKGDSDIRGSFSILSTCAITLLLGVYSAVHLNLPGNPRSWTEALLRRTGWIIITLFAPEVLVLVAWSQLLAAKRVQKKVDEMFRHGTAVSVCGLKWRRIGADGIQTDAEANLPTLKNKWTMTHSFWAVMGGLAINANESERFVPSDLSPKLTEKGINLLLKKEPTLLPDISEDDLKDKSKGDWLTKSLACIQATWFCVSCLVRVGQQLPLSLLELNTFAHAICTIIVYFIWWKKPLDVERPVLITSERARPLLAFMWMSSKTSARADIKDHGDRTYTVGRDPEFEAIDQGPKLPINSRETADRSDAIPPRVISVTPTKGLSGTGFSVNAASTRWIVTVTWSTGSDESAQVHSYTRHDPARFDLMPADVKRWRCAQEAINKYKLVKPTKNLDLVRIKPVSEMAEFSTADEEDWITQAKHPWDALGFAMLSACYGILHALAWNAKFPSRRQRILWRVSSILIAGSSGAWLLFMILLMGIRLLLSFKTALSRRRRTKASSNKTSTSVEDIQPPVSTNVQPQSDKPKHQAGTVLGVQIPDHKLSGAAHFAWVVLKGVIKWVLLYATGAYLCLYVPARTYVVGDSFRMAFYLPPDAFRATNWEKYFPHFG
jgi:hypothetical protein